MMATSSLRLLVLLAAVGLCIGCFITNCPPGGKRFSGSMGKRSQNRECMRCGPGGMGQCHGPDICCGPLIGCHLRGPLAFECRAEDSSPIPCHVTTASRTCTTPNGQPGNCGADSVCCSSESCHIDPTCAMSGTHNGARATPQLSDLSPAMEWQERI